MNQHTKFSRTKLAGGAMLATAAAATAAAALGGAGAANATCASISGIGAGSGCTSSPTSFAVGIGTNTVANAQGLFTGAIAFGPTNGAGDATVADSQGAFSLAMAVGKNTQAVTRGNLAVAAAIGDNTAAQAGLTSGDNLNVAINTALGETVKGGAANAVIAGGQGNLAANIGGTSSATRVNLVQAVGLGNVAFNLGGKGNAVSAGTLLPATKASTLGMAFNVLGNDNDVTAFGPLAIAGAIGKNGLNGANAVTQVGPGLNINNM